MQNKKLITIQDLIIGLMGYYDNIFSLSADLDNHTKFLKMIETNGYFSIGLKKI
jgi:hypothetical protein